MALPRDFSVYDETGTNRLYYNNEYEFPTMITVYSFLTANVPGVRYISKTIGGTPYSDDASMRHLYNDGAYTVYAIPFPSTIAGQIERLQYDKSRICTAIENKGVTVGNVTLDDYSACIDAISSGEPSYKVDVLAVGGGGGGGSGRDYGSGGGGGGGGVVCYNNISLQLGNSCVIIGAGGGPETSGGTSCICDGCGVKVVAIGGIGGAYGSSCKCHYGSGAGGGSGNGFKGGGTYTETSCTGSGGGGGASAAGGGGGGGTGGSGGAGLYGYGGGGGGGGPRSGGSGGSGGGGGGGHRGNGGNATAYGGGGGGASCYCTGGCGCKGIVIICYKTDGSCGITCATGGTVTTSGGFKIHSFTDSGNFCIKC